MDNHQVLAGPHRNKQSSAVTPKEHLELLVSLMSRCRRSVGGSQDTETQSMQTQGEHRISTTAWLWGDSDYFPSIAVLTPSSNPSAVWTPPHACRETRSVSHSFHLPSILLWCCRRRYVSQGSTTPPHPLHPSLSFQPPSHGRWRCVGGGGRGVLASLFQTVAHCAEFTRRATPTWVISHCRWDAICLLPGLFV